MENYYYGQVLNLNIGDIIKNNSSLCDVFDIMREMICKLEKKIPKETLV